MSGEVDRENCGADGGLTVSRARTLGKALLLLAAAAALLFGGELAVQAQTFEPLDKCSLSGTKVTCTGDLSGGVDVDGGNGTYTRLDVNKLDGDIAPEDAHGINFVSNSNIEIIVDAVDHSIMTSGDNRQGIRARSTGGSGGDVTVNVTTDAITTTGDDSEGIEAYSNRGGAIEVTMTGDITTGTTGSEGIDARSEETGDNGGSVTVTVTGDITTMGNQDSEGIYARSRHGDAGPVTVTVTGNITTRGGCEVLNSEDNCSEGIKARSEGGGDVTVTVTGDITTMGEGSDGIYARANTGSIGITLNGGAITSDQGVGVRFVDGSALNTLTISEGAAVTISGGGDDVLGGDNNEKIDNYGTLTTPGRIRLGGGNNAFNNHAGATFNSGTEVVLGSNNRFTNAGDLSPGGANAVQTTTLTGDFQNFIEVEDENGNPVKEYGTFTVTIDPTATADEEPNDLLTVRGNATLEGGTVRVAGVTYAYDDTYTILNVPGSNTLSGKFDGVIDTLFIDHSLSYDPNNKNVMLSSTSKGDSFSDFAGTPNQLAVANALDSLLSPNKNTELVQAGRARTTTAEAQAASNGNNPIVKAVLALTTTAGAQAAYDNLSGEVHASLKGALMDTGQRPVAAVHRRLTARGRQPDARTSTATVGDLSSRADDQTGFWMIGYDAWSDTKGTSNTAQMDTDLGGGLFGMDRALGKHGHVGILGGYSQTSVAQQARISSGSVETWSVGLYGGAEAGASRLRVGALYNGHSVTTRRTVGFTGYSLERLSARYDAWSWQVFGEAGYQLQVRELLLEPFAGVSHISLETDGFSETGGIAALTASSDTNSRTLTTLGVRSAMELKAMIQARGMVGWRHAFGDTDPSSTHTLANIATDTTLGAPTAEDAVVTELGLEVGLSAHAVLGVAYQGQYGDGVTVHGFNAGLKLTF